MKNVNWIKTGLLFLLNICYFSSIQAQPAALTLDGNAANLNVVNVASINSEKLDFSPSYYQNGLVFVSSRKKGGRMDDKIGETFFELFYAEFDGNGMPIAAEEFSLEANTQLHEGQATFSPDGQMMIFTSNNQTNGAAGADANGVTRLKIYSAKKGRFDWTDVTELPFNSDEYSIMHPSLSPDGTKLFFASDMPGGIGGFDIYMVKKDGDSYSAPINLGPAVNTAQNEAFPFAHASGNIFFASLGHNGRGGFDLFKATMAGDSFTGTTNLGEPFNSTGDDFGLIMNAPATSGYFTSNRGGGAGMDDIYRFDAAAGFVAPELPDLNALIRVYDAQTNARLEGAEIRVFERTADGLLAGGDLYDVILMPERSGSNELVMKLVRKDASNLGDADLRTDAQGETPYDMAPEKQYILFVSKDDYLTNEVIYSTAGKSGDLVVEVPLDKKRCATLKGVVTDRATGQILANSTVRIASTCATDIFTTTSDASGRFEYCLPPGCDYSLTGQRTGYNDGIGKVSIPVGAKSDVSADLKLSPIPTVKDDGNYLAAGSVIVLDKIYYDFNKSTIRTGAARELDELVSIMQRYPSMQIELISHTDSRGGADYNQVLSLRRAESAKRYLVSRGIASSRIIALGFGESQLRNGCGDGSSCSEEEHQYNRRTEVRVTRIDEAVRVEYGNNGPEIIDRRRY